MKIKKFMFLQNYILVLFIVLLDCTSKPEKVIFSKSINRKGEVREIEVKGENIKLLNIKNSNAEKILIPSNILDYKEIDLSKIVSHIEIIPLETSSLSVFGQANKILKHSSFYFVHDKRNDKLLRFNNEGKFLNSIGTLGKGPKELLSIWDVAINGEKEFISILDSKGRKISKYKFTGEYLDSQPLFYAMSQHEYVDNDLVFNVSKAQINSHIPPIESYCLIIADKNSVPLSLAFKNPKKSNTYKTLNPLRNFDNTIYYHHPYSDGIWKVKDNNLFPIIKFVYEKDGVNEDLWKKSINNSELKKILNTHNFFSGNYVITDAFSYFQFFIKGKVSNLFFNRISKSVIYGSNFKFDKSDPLSVFINAPIGCKDNTSFISILEAFQLDQRKEFILKNEELKNLLTDSDLEKIMKVKETDNPVIVTYKLKDF